MEWWEDLYNRQVYFDLYEEDDTHLAEQQVQQVLALLHPSGGASILDLCCGYGRHSIKLAQHVHFLWLLSGRERAEGGAPRHLSGIETWGTFLLDFWNREKEIRQFQPLTCEKARDLIIVKEWQFDALGGRINWSNTVIFPDGKRESWEHSMRAYTVAELKALLEETGFRFEAVYAG